MTILACGGEMGFFIPADSEVIEGTGVNHNSSFTRTATQTPRSTAYAETVSVSATADFWIHFEIDAGSLSAGSIGAICTLFDSGGTGRVRVRSGGGDSATMYLEYWNGTAWVEINHIAIAMNGLQTIDLHVVSNTASGSSALYVAGTERITSGTIDLSAFSGITKAQFAGRASGTYITMGVSQVIMADESTIGMRVMTVAMTGAGANTSWVGSYDSVDESAYSDADFIFSATADEVETYAGTPVSAVTGYNIRAVAVTARARRASGSGPQNMELVLRSGGTEYFSASKSLGLGYGAYCEVWNTDPNTTLDWAAGAISGLQYGVKSVA